MLLCKTNGAPVIVGYEIRCKQRNFILPNYVSINKTHITNRRATLNCLNSHFVNVADALNNSRYESTATVPDFKKFLKNRSVSQIEFTQIQPSEIFDIVSNIDTYKATDISPKIIKSSINV